MQVEALVIKQGDSYEAVVDYVNDDTGEANDLTGYTARLALALSHDDLPTFEAQPSELTVQATLGRILIRIPAHRTAAIPAGRYVYDLEVSNSSTGKTETVLEGHVTVVPQVRKG